MEDLKDVIIRTIFCYLFYIEGRVYRILDRLGVIFS